MSRPQFLTLTQPDGRKIAFNVAHIIAISPAVPYEWDQEPRASTMIFTTIGTEGQNWHEWSVVETYDDIGMMITRMAA